MLCRRRAIDDTTRNILMSKPERVAGFDTELAGRLRKSIGERRAALVEVAGRDSIAAAVSASKSGVYDFFVPTIVYTGTESGDWEVVLENSRSVAVRMGLGSAPVFDETVILGSPGWWHASAGRYSGWLNIEYGFQATCIACHMYLHAVRIPFAREIGARAIVSGERLRHDGRIKLNQLAPAIDAYARIAEKAGLALELPLRDIDEGHLIEELAGEWPESERQMSCVLESNYRDAAGDVCYPEDGLTRYISEFLEPFTERIIACFIEHDRSPDYESIAGGLVRERSGI